MSQGEYFPGACSCAASSLVSQSTPRCAPGAGGDRASSGALPAPSCSSAETTQGQRGKGPVWSHFLPVLSVNLFSPSSMKLHFNSKALKGFIGSGLKCFAEAGPRRSRCSEVILNCIHVLFFPLASDKDSEPEFLVVPCQGQERARYSIGALPMAWGCGLSLFHSSTELRLQQHRPQGGWSHIKNK